MKKNLLVLLIICSVMKLPAQTIGYVGVGYQGGYTRGAGLNNFLKAYNESATNKIGGYQVTDLMNMIHLMHGVVISGGYYLKDGRVLELRYVGRKASSQAILELSDRKYSFQVDYSMPTLGFSTYKIYKSSGNTDSGWGVALDLNMGKLTRSWTDYTVSSNSFEREVDTYFNAAFTPYWQINKHIFGRDFPLMLTFRPYYQFNLKKRDFTELDRQVKNVFDDRKLKSTMSNIGVEVSLVYTIKPIKKKEKPLIVKEEPVEEPIPVKDELTSGFVIKGKVLDKKTGQPIPGANVMVADPNTGAILGKTIAGADGTYRLELKEGSDFNITAQGKGYLTNHEEAKLAAEQSSVEKDILLEEILIGTSVNLKSVLFEKGTAKLVQASYRELDRLITFMEENPTVFIQLDGHTSNEGDVNLNIQLSEERVKAVKDYLIKKGISTYRVTLKAYGPSKPLYPNDTEEHRRLNRRVEFTITKK